MYRIDKLLKFDRKLFHTRDLALLWGIANDNSLYTLIKRYVAKGILIPIHKGFYATVPAEQIDPIELGIGFLHRYAYVSCEHILSLYNVIFQHSPIITLVSSVSKKFTVANHQYIARKLKDAYLFNPIGIDRAGTCRKAKLERAVADLLYFNPRYHLDNPKAIDWEKVAKIKKEVGYK